MQKYTAENYEMSLFMENDWMDVMDSGSVGAY